MMYSMERQRVLRKVMHMEEEPQPLTPAILASVNVEERKLLLGNRLYPVIQKMVGSRSFSPGKITGMLLELDNSVLLYLLEHRRSLKAKVDEAISVLEAYQIKESANQPTKEEKNMARKLSP